MSSPKDVRTLFDEALELPAIEREAFLRRECGGNVELFENVAGLVRAHLNATAMLDSHAPVPGSVIESIDGAAMSNEDIGPYRVIRKIGEGGMGSVYLGLRSDDAFRKIVAIKVMRPDRATEEFSRRFKQERQVLANLDHTNIARILDGGTTDDGLPYYVMDYVDGKRIDDYCNDARLGLVDRVKLFQQVCSAVNYLHENLIVHRDLKPSNILVTANGVAKLLDFGIAKVQAPGNSNQTIDYDGRPTRLMTPGYASPEQINGESVTRASDIYSLGIILYELLTGRQPFPGSASSDIDELVRNLESEPPKPSTNVRDDLKHSGETTSQLKRRLAGDLDNIVLMALRRNPAARYATVSDFVGDLQSYLDGKGIKALKETVAIRTVKLVRRNPVRSTMGLSILLLLVFGAWQTVQAYGQRIRADAKEAEIARLIAVLSGRLDQWAPAGATVVGSGFLRPEEQVRDLRQMNRILTNDFSDLLLLRPGRTLQRDSLIQRAVHYFGQAEQRARSNVVVVREVARGYLSVAGLQSRPVDDGERRGFGDSIGAISNYRNSGVLYIDLARREPNDADLQNELQIVRTELAALSAAPLPTAAESLLLQAPLQAPPRQSETPQPPPAQPEKSGASVVKPQTTPPAPTLTTPEPAPSQAAAANSELSPELAETIQRFINVESKIRGADSRVESWRRELAARGMPERADIVSTASRMKVNLQLAKQELDRKDAQMARTYLDRADADAARVLTFFGR